MYFVGHPKWPTEFRLVATNLGQMVMLVPAHLAKLVATNMLQVSTRSLMAKLVSTHFAAS